MTTKTTTPSDRGAVRRRVKRIFNVRLLVETLVVAAVLAPALYFWYCYQMNRTAEKMRQTAEKMQKAADEMRQAGSGTAKAADDAAMVKDYDTAAKYCFQYLKLKPGDVDVQVLLAETFGRAAKDRGSKVQAVNYYYQAIGAAPSAKQPALRRQLAGLLLEIGRFDQAADEAEKVLDHDSKNAEASQLRARALYYGQLSGRSRRGVVGRSEVGPAVVSALALNPADIELAVILARIYREDPLLLDKKLLYDKKKQLLSAEARGNLADGVMNKMLERNPKNVNALLAHHAYLSRYNPKAAKEELAAAIKDYPENLEVVLLAGDSAMSAAESARRNGESAKKVETQLEEAQKHYEHAIAIFSSGEHPVDPRVAIKYSPYRRLASLYRREAELEAAAKARAGKPEAAVKAWQEKLQLAAQTLRDGLKQADASPGKASKKADNGPSDLTIYLTAGLADTLLVQPKLDEAGKTIDCLEEMVEQVTQRRPPDQLTPIKRTADLLRGQWLIAERRYLEAVTCLRGAAVDRPTGVEETAQSVAAWQLLGDAYAGLAQWDQAALAHEHAVALQPTLASHHLRAAAAWLSAGRLDAAEQHYRLALSLQPSAEAELGLAQLLLDQQLRLPKKERDWDSFNRALEGAKKAGEATPSAGGWRVKLLEADYLATIADKPGDTDESTRKALAICRKTEREYAAKAIELLPPLAETYERLGQPADADRLVEQLRTTRGQEAAACLLKAQLCVSRKQPEEARKVLAAALKALPEEARSVIRHRLVRLDAQEGKADLVREHLLEGAQTKSPDLASLVQLAGMALEKRDLAEVEQWESKLRKIEGEDGVFWQYYRAYRLLAEATGPEDGELVEALHLQASIELRRPSWEKAHTLKGLLLDARGDVDRAVMAYREAVALGERSPSVVRLLISRLLETNRSEEAEQYLPLLRGEALLAADYDVLRRAVEAKRVRVDRALESAHRTAEQLPADPLAQLWLGQLLSTDKEKTAQAEAAFKKAVALGPGEPRPAEELFNFYWRSSRSGDAREVLQSLEKKKKHDDVRCASLLARGYRLLGDKEQALGKYREAARLDPKNAALQVQLAEYLGSVGTTANAAEAERLLHDVLDKSPKSFAVARAKQLLVAILAARGGRENLDKVQRILETSLADPKKASDHDRRLLAKLFESVGNVEGAQQQYLALITRGHVDPADRAAYFKLLLKEARFQDADAELKKWEVEQRNDLGVASLRARWLHAKGQLNKIEPLLEPLAEKAVERLPKDSTQQGRLMLEMGGLYSSLDLHKVAERWYRRVLAVQPKSYPFLAESLARQGRMKEAIELCRDAAKSDSSTAPAIAATAVLLVGSPSAEGFALAEPLLAKVAAEHKDDVVLLAALGNVRVAQQRLDEAVVLFRRALALAPNERDLLNDLATVLAERPENRQDASRFVDQAIEISGQRPELLDTKGTILLLDGKPAEAVPLLEQAALSLDADPRYCFHLAVAYDRAGQPEKAREAFRTASKNHLTRQILTPTDKSLLEELQKKFN